MFTDLDEAKIKIGDKIFVYGQFREEIDVSNASYNIIKGYMTICQNYDRIDNLTEENNCDVIAILTKTPESCIPGLVIETSEFMSGDLKINVGDVHMVDVTDNLVHQTPMLSGTRVWLPTIRTQPPQTVHTV